MVDEWSLSEADLFTILDSSVDGLTTHESTVRSRDAAPALALRRTGVTRLLMRQFSNPTILILIGTAVVAAALGQLVESSIVIAIVATSGLLGFVQERTAVGAVHALLQSVSVHSEVLRDGLEREILSSDVVVGDVVVLRTGDVVPGDGRVIAANHLLVDEATLSGESYPLEKSPGALAPTTPRHDRKNMVYCGTYVSSGEGRMIVVRTGRDTEFGQITSHVSSEHLPTSFERGITSFGYLLMRAMVVLVLLVFVVNMVLRRPVIDSILFSLALAIGLTPQMLPAIVTLSLSRGARLMAKKHVIVKRLDAIEDIGGLDVLCVDKTGTITEGDVVLESHLDPTGSSDDFVLSLAHINASLQRGFENPIDRAILRHSPSLRTTSVFVDEIPFDFTRRRMSVIVSEADSRRIVCKGAVRSVLEICSTIRAADAVVSLAPRRADIETLGRRLAEEGFRVLGVAFGDIDSRSDYSPDDERDLTFAGFLSFGDPPKPGIASVIDRLASLGVSVRIITGDSSSTAMPIASRIGVVPLRCCTGTELEAVPVDDLPRFVEDYGVFAEIDPIQKERIVRAFTGGGHAVGFMGDGINDAPALHAADVGVSVTGAVDVAKETADVVLLDKDLGVLAAGIAEGRRVFANTLKYVHITTSANFGNMLSLASATAFLPFLPLLPLQVLLLNFLSDVPGMTIATDRVEPEHLQRPLRWDVHRVRNFMIVFGLASTIFDLLTFGSLYFVFSSNATELRSGWFIESMLNELIVLLMLRTSRPFWRSEPGHALLWSSIGVAMVVLVLPYSPLASELGLAGPPFIVMIALIVITVLSIVTTEILKHYFVELVEPG